jgi:hypothetical protein
LNICSCYVATVSLTRQSVISVSFTSRPRLIQVTEFTPLEHTVTKNTDTEVYHESEITHIASAGRDTLHGRADTCCIEPRARFDTDFLGIGTQFNGEAYTISNHQYLPKDIETDEEDLSMESMSPESERNGEIISR